MSTRNSGLVTYRDRDHEYQGEYATIGQTITVTWKGAQEVTQIGDAADSPEYLARRLLGEMVEKAKRGAK